MAEKWTSPRPTRDVATLAVGCDAAAGRLPDDLRRLRRRAAAALLRRGHAAAGGRGGRSVRPAHGVEIACDYAGSEVLLSRIKLTREGDLYMPGDTYYVDLAAGEGLIASQTPVCYFVPVILVQKGNPKKIHGLADLTRPDVGVGLGDPEACAVGHGSRRASSRRTASRREDVNVKVRTVTVNELVNHVKLKTLDAAIVWDAVAAFAPRKPRPSPFRRRRTSFPRWPSRSSSRRSIPNWPGSSSSSSPPTRDGRSSRNTTTRPRWGPGTIALLSRSRQNRGRAAPVLLSGEADRSSGNAYRASAAVK